MKTIVLFLGLISVAHSSIIIFAPLPSQYHAQDIFGQYSYGYAGGPSAKQETHTANGITHGGYSYIDANGVIQTVNYVADPVNGFRVAATNIPQPIAADGGPPDSPEVSEAKKKHFEAHEEAKAKLRKTRSVVYPYAIAYHPIPLPHQYQAVDSFGQYSYGYNDGFSAKAEARSLTGVTHGAYSYVDKDGKVQSVEYVADSLGFRPKGDGIPVGPQSKDLPVPPSDTPEVNQARAEHLAAVEKAKNGGD